MDNFFKHYPLIRYGNTVSNTVAVNIFAKIAFQKSIQQNFETFHPYTIKEGDRADTIASLYYGDSGYDWIVYFSNNVVDPYYDWYMDSNSLNRFIAEKYQSLTDARRKTKFFRSNYISDDSMITPAAYNALSANQKRFWYSVNGINNNIIRYERKKEDVVFQTNKTQQISISLVGNTSFDIDEYVFQQNAGVTVGSATVNFANSTVVIVCNVIGTLSTAYNLKGGNSGANATVSAVNTLSTSIASDIQSYFESVSFFDYENELNEEKKNIRLIDLSYVQAIEDEFKNLLSS
jgi:hypothetical protein